MTKFWAKIHGFSWKVFANRNFLEIFGILGVEMHIFYGNLCFYYLNREVFKVLDHHDLSGPPTSKVGGGTLSHELYSHRASQIFIQNNVLYKLFAWPDLFAYPHIALLCVVHGLLYYYYALCYSHEMEAQARPKCQAEVQSLEQGHALAWYKL